MATMKYINTVLDMGKYRINLELKEKELAVLLTLVSKVKKKNPEMDISCDVVSQFHSDTAPIRPDTDQRAKKKEKHEISVFIGDESCRIKMAINKAIAEMFDIISDSIVDGTDCYINVVKS